MKRLAATEIAQGYAHVILAVLGKTKEAKMGLIDRISSAAVLSTADDPPDAPDQLDTPPGTPPAAPCPACSCPSFYIDPYAMLHCAACEPPPSPAFARRRLMAVLAPGGHSPGGQSPGGPWAWECSDQGDNRPAAANQPATPASPAAEQPNRGGAWGGDADCYLPRSPIDRSLAAAGQSVDEWFRSLEGWSKDESGNRLTTRPMTVEPSDEWMRENFPAAMAARIEARERMAAAAKMSPARPPALRQNRAEKAGRSSGGNGEASNAAANVEAVPPDASPIAPSAAHTADDEPFVLSAPAGPASLPGRFSAPVNRASRPA